MTIQGARDAQQRERQHERLHPVAQQHTNDQEDSNNRSRSSGRRLSGHVHHPRAGGVLLVTISITIDKKGTIAIGWNHRAIHNPTSSIGSTACGWSKYRLTA